MKSVELVLGKEASTRVGELTLDGKAKVTATSHAKVKKGWRVIAIGGKKVKAADIQMALGMAQGRGKPYKVRFALPTKEQKAADGETEEDDPDDDEVIIEEIDEDAWEGDDDGELLYADLAKAEAEREAEEAARLEAERLAAAERAKLVGASIKKKVANPFAGKI